MEKKEFTEDERVKGAKFKNCMASNGYNEIANFLSDDAAYDMMFCLNWLAAGPLNKYDEFSKQFRIAVQLSNDGNKQMINEFQSEFLSRARYYLELSNQNDDFIQNKLVTFASLLMDMYCNPNALQAIFSSYFNKNKVRVNQ